MTDLIIRDVVINEYFLTHSICIYILQKFQLFCDDKNIKHMIIRALAVIKTVVYNIKKKKKLNCRKLSKLDLTTSWIERQKYIS